MINLVSKPNNEWLVVHVINKEVVNSRFASIEGAADMMVSLGVQDEAIDKALCHLVGYGHKRAIFNDKGNFAITDAE